MEFTALDFCLITLLNTAVCLAFPRLITLNWSNVFSKSLQGLDNNNSPRIDVIKKTYT